MRNLIWCFPCNLVFPGKFLKPRMDANGRERVWVWFAFISVHWRFDPLGRRVICLPVLRRQQCPLEKLDQDLIEGMGVLHIAKMSRAGKNFQLRAGDLLLN